MKKTSILFVSLILSSTLIIGCSSTPASSFTTEYTTEVTTTENTVESEKAEHYAKADELFAAGKYEEAIEEYKKADDYSDSKEKIFNIYHSQAEKALSGERYEEAIEYYKKASDFKDTSDEIAGVYYVQGEKALAASEFDKAIAFFQNAGTYKDATTKLSEIAYTQAEEAIKSKDNKAAAKYFADAGNYKDAAERANAIYYSLGATSVKKKAYDEAIECFTNAGDYKDAKKQVQLARYNKGKVLISKKQYEEAAKELKGTGDYEAAKNLLDTTITALINSKDYENAEKMAEYSDSPTSADLKNYINGRKAFNAGDYPNAILSFEKAKDVKDSAVFINASNYNLGLNAIKEGEFIVAEGFFTKSGDYKNSKLMRNVCSAEFNIENGNYKEAAKYYAQIPKNTKVNGVNIQSHKALMNRIASFEKIRGSYSARSNLIKTTQYWRRDKRYNESWYVKKVISQHDLTLDYSVNSDGTINLTGQVTYYHYTNYSSISALVEGQFDTSYFQLNNLKRIPTNAVIDNHLRLKYKKGKFSVHYYEKDNYSQYFYNVYKTTINFRKDS